jgi:hypothetical protein
MCQKAAENAAGQTRPRGSSGCCRTETSKDITGCCRTDMSKDSTAAVGQTRPKTSQAALGQACLKAAQAAIGQTFLMTSHVAVGQTRPKEARAAVRLTGPKDSTSLYFVCFAFFASSFLSFRLFWFVSLTFDFRDQCFTQMRNRRTLNVKKLKDKEAGGTEKNKKVRGEQRTCHFQACDVRSIHFKNFLSAISTDCDCDTPTATASHRLRRRRLII